MHIPPGIDAYSTVSVAHRFFVVPFMRKEAREEFVDLLDNPENHVDFAFAGHTHHFSYRLSDRSAAHDVPILIVPSISPIFHNAPSFLTMNVSRDGGVRGVTEYANPGGGWQKIGGLTDLGVSVVDSASLLALQKRLENDADLWNTFERLYGGGVPPQIEPKFRRQYLCAATEQSATAFRECTGQHGVSIFTGRALALAGIGLAIVAVPLTIYFAVILWLRRNTSGASP
jgi:hypothetical protein